MRQTDPSTHDSQYRGQAGRDRLQALLAFDWPSAGLAPPDDWEPPLAAALPLVALASLPMALMIGPRGILVPNAGLQALLGARAGSDVTGRPVVEVLPESAGLYPAILARTIAGQACSLPAQPVQVGHGSESTTAWFDLEFIPVADAGGTVHAVLVVAFDVSHHVSQARSLRDAEQRLRLALESSGMVGIWDLDVRTNLSTADANVARTFGLLAPACRQGLDDSLFVQAIHEDDRPAVASALREAVEHGRPYRCRYRVCPREGEVRWVIASGKPAYDEAGKLVRLLGVIVDVTDQVETASALAESRFRFQTLTETLPQIVWSCDARGRHDYFSASWSEFTGIPAQDIDEDTWKRLVHPEDRAAASRAWQAARDAGTPYDVDYRLRHHTGVYRWLRVMALPIRDEHGRVTRWFGTSTDVHDAYLAAEERERLTRELQRIATEDPLTGLLTRRAFLDRAAAALADAAGKPAPLSLLMLDIDHFKAINDTYGHPDGDVVLAAVARRLRASVNRDDLVGRLGGEEFAILLRGCSAGQAIGVAERIRLVVGREPVALEDGRRVPVTLSIGISGSAGAGDEDDLEQMLRRADQALYRAKAAGRDRSVGPDGAMPPAG